MTSQPTIDDLQYQKTQLVKQINEARRQLTSLDNQIKTLTQVTSESPRIQAFVDRYKDLSYTNGTFYYRPNEPFTTTSNGITTTPLLTSVSIQTAALPFTRKPLTIGSPTPNNVVTSPLAMATPTIQIR